jgi:hypothetical protein
MTKPLALGIPILYWFKKKKQKRTPLQPHKSVIAEYHCHVILYDLFDKMLLTSSKFTFSDVVKVESMNNVFFLWPIKSVRTDFCGVNGYSIARTMPATISE